MTYENATYYDCFDSEDYTHETPDEAIEYLLDAEMTPNCDAEKVIRDQGSIEVKAYNRDKVTPGWIDRLACRLAELAEEEWSDEYGSPDGDGFKEGAIGHLVERFSDTLTEVIPQQQVWRCSECDSYTYSVEEVLALMRDHRPDWFEEPEDAGHSLAPSPAKEPSMKNDVPFGCDGVACNTAAMIRADKEKL